MTAAGVGRFTLSIAAAGGEMSGGRLVLCIAAAAAGGELAGRRAIHVKYC